MSVQSTKQKNVYLEKINENLLSFFRTIEKFNQNLNELSQFIDSATAHINAIERILGHNDDNDDDNDNNNEDDGQIFEYDKELISGEKLCELNENLNISIREIRQSW